MQLDGIEGNSYFFWNQDTKEYEYNHKYLVPGTETKKYGMKEKNSGWTELTAMQYAKKYGVSIIKSGKRVAKKKKKKAA